ncbi:conjugal transfer protein TraX [Escherichia coli]|nr:conjugal transfer protein TraX [Escherichia coli]
MAVPRQRGCRTAGKLLSRFWPGDFFPTFYACHLAVLGVLAL